VFRVLTWHLNVSVQQKYLSLKEGGEGGVGMQSCKLTFFVGGILLVWRKQSGYIAHYWPSSIPDPESVGLAYGESSLTNLSTLGKSFTMCTCAPSTFCDCHYSLLTIVML